MMLAGLSGSGARRALGRVLRLSALALLPCAVRAQPIFLGDEFQVNTVTSGSQVHPSVAAAGGDGFVVVWERATGASGHVYGQLFDLDGDPQAAEFEINEATAGVSFHPDVAAVRGEPSSDTGFVVVWHEPYTDGDSTGVFGQRLFLSGDPLSAEFQINSHFTSGQASAAVAMDGTSAFVVVWRSDGQDGDSGGVFGQRFDVDENAEGSEFQVNTFSYYSQYSPDVAMDDDGDFVVVWSSYQQDLHSGGIFGQRFDTKGDPVGAEFQIHTDAAYGQTSPAVAMDDDGDFVVVWETTYTLYLIPPTGPPPIFVPFFFISGQRFDSAGDRVGGEFTINSLLTSSQVSPDVALADDGSFLVTWQGNEPGEDSSDIRGRIFDADGNPQGEFQINTYEEESQTRPAVATGGEDFVVVWESDLQDGDQSGIFGQRLSGTPAPTPSATATLTPSSTPTATPTGTATPTPTVTSTPAGVPLDVDKDGETDPLTDGLLALRWLFGFIDGALIAGAVDTNNCMRCMAGEIEDYLAALGDILDIDDDREVEALTDGLLILRWLFGFTDGSLIAGAVDTMSCGRCDAEEIEDYLDMIDGP